MSYMSKGKDYLKKFHLLNPVREVATRFTPFPIAIHTQTHTDIYIYIYIYKYICVKQVSKIVALW